MAVQLAKDSIDLGIVVRDPASSLAFYRDTLGFELVDERPMPIGGGTMYRLCCGTSMIKLVHLTREPPAAAPPGGIAGGYGYRYWTITVTNIDAVTAACERAGYHVVIPVHEIRLGTSIAIVEDPDGNWVEFLHVR